MLLFKPYSESLKEKGFGGVKIRKVAVNGGFTCPNLDGSKGRGGCTYCDNRSFSPVAGSRGISITHQLDRGIAYSKRHFGAQKFIAYFQTYSGTYAPIERLRDLYAQALDHPEVVGLSVSTRPDCVETETAALLEELGQKNFVTLELGLQSAFDESLQRVNRAHTFSDFVRAMDLCLDRGFDLCVHTILGLPGESRRHFCQTAERLQSWKYDSIKLHPLHVVKGTVLAEQYSRGEYSPLSFQDYVEGVVDFLERIPESVGIQRFTGDAPEHLLLSPAWCREKQNILNAMKKEFQKRGTRQGCRVKS